MAIAAESPRAGLWQGRRRFCCLSIIWEAVYWAFSSSISTVGRGGGSATNTPGMVCIRCTCWSYMVWLLFTGSIPRGVFCEWSVAEVTDSGPSWVKPGAAAPNRVFSVCVHREACYWPQPGGGSNMVCRFLGNKAVISLLKWYYYGKIGYQAMFDDSPGGPVSRCSAVPWGWGLSVIRPGEIDSV